MPSENAISAAYWERLAEEQEERAKDLSHGSTAPAQNRAVLYRRTAASLRLEILTGKPHCSCCLKPFREGGVSCRES